MVKANPQADLFKQQMRALLAQKKLPSQIVTIAKNKNVYARGDTDGFLYFIERGQIKLLLRAPDGKDCLWAIHAAGDIFGESCLSGLGTRLETATAMEETVITHLSCATFLARLKRGDLLTGFLQHLTGRLAQQQQIIAELLTVNSEQRLGQTLLRLARTIGQKSLRSTRLEARLTHAELSEMVGTTRPRISTFMQRFLKLGLIEADTRHSLLIKEKKLTKYLAQIA
jgi:CRP/FNR family transcriptional regulator, cyclic AMP receptor protein